MIDQLWDSGVIPLGILLIWVFCEGVLWVRKRTSDQVRMKKRPKGF